jgi:hypothetical protein
MSSLAAWSYTSKATHWPLQVSAAFGATLTFGAPTAFDCDYAADRAIETKERGDEIGSGLRFYTEKADIKPGDRIVLGVSALADPAAAGALTVQRVLRNADTFERLKDDYEVIA